MALPFPPNHHSGLPNQMHQQQQPPPHGATGFPSQPSQLQSMQYIQNGSIQNGSQPHDATTFEQQQQNFHANKLSANFPDATNSYTHPQQQQAVSSRPPSQPPVQQMNQPYAMMPVKYAANNYENGAAASDPVANLQNSLAGMSVSPGTAAYPHASQQQKTLADGNATGNNYDVPSQSYTQTTRDVNNYAGNAAAVMQQHSNLPPHAPGGMHNNLPSQPPKPFAIQTASYGGTNQSTGIPPHSGIGAPLGYPPQNSQPNAVLQYLPSSTMSSTMPNMNMPPMPGNAAGPSGQYNQQSSGYNSYAPQQQQQKQQQQQQQQQQPPSMYPSSNMPPSGAMPPPGLLSQQPGYAPGALPSGPPGAPGMQPYQQQPQQQQPPGMLPRGPLGGGAPQLGGSAGGLNRTTLPDLQRFLDRDREIFRQGAFVSGPLPNPQAVPPPNAMTRFINYDQGLASPRFIRSTMNVIPDSEKLLKETGLPFVLYLSPFAEQPDGEEPIPVIDYRPATIIQQAQANGMLSGNPSAAGGGNAAATAAANSEEDPLKVPGPVRCTRCKAYMCPFMTFVDGGQRFKCAFCPMTTDVPAYYASYMDSEGNRQDKMSRPELHRGVYEFIVGDLYGRDNKEPQSPPAFLFMIDVSYNAITNGMVVALCEYLRQELPALLDLRSNLDAEARGEHNKEPPSIRVGFATYAVPEVHFYNVSRDLERPQMMVVSDCDDMFVPLGGIDASQGLLVDYRQCAANIDKLLRMIPTMFTNSKTTSSMVAPVIKAGMEAIKASCPGGKIFMFHCSLPNYENAPGVLRSRDQRNVLGTEKEKEQLKPMPGDSGKLYTKLAQDCVEEAGCSVDLFLFPNNYIDVATLGELCRITGGSLYKYSYFSADKDRQRLFADVKRAVSRHGCAAFDAVVRIRTSLGLRPTDFYGSMHMKNTSEILLGSIDSDKSLAVEIKYDDKLEKGQNAFFQVAVLYTHPCGQRRVRVINAAFPVVNANNAENNEFTQIFNAGELLTLINVWLKKHATMLVQRGETPVSIRRSIITDCINILATYRRFSDTRSSGNSALLLPERFTPMPLLCLALSRCDALSGGADVLSADDKSTFILDALQMSIPNSIDFIHPKVISLLPLLMELLNEGGEKESSTDGSQQSAADDSNDDIITLSARLPRPVRCSMEEIFPAQLNPQQLHQLQQQQFQQQQQGGQAPQITIPKKADGIFVLENGFGMFLWVGPEVDKRILRLAFGVSSLQELAASAGLQYSSAQSAMAAPVTPQGRPQGTIMPQQQQQQRGGPLPPGAAPGQQQQPMGAAAAGAMPMGGGGSNGADQGVPELDNPVNRRLRKLLRTIRAQKPQHWMRLSVVAGGAEPVLEQHFKRFLIEDRGPNPQIQQAYGEYVVAVHFGVLESLQNSS